MRHASDGTLRRAGAGLAVLCVVTWGAAALGESDRRGVAESGMEQGSGAITTRSDVEVEVESLRGTSRARLGAVGEAVSTKLGAIRACYTKVTQQRPTREGELRIEVRVPEGRGPTKVDVAVDEVGDRELSDCVAGALRAADYRGVKGPAGGLVVVGFANSAASGARMVAAERGRAPSEAVERTPEGRPRVTTTTPGGEVTVVVVAEGETTAEALVALHQSVQARIGTLLDARRRASRRDMDPAGQIVVHLTIARGGVGRGRSLSSTVQDSTASGRVVTALTGAARGLRAAAGSYRVTVTFAGN